MQKNIKKLMFSAILLLIFLILPSTSVLADETKSYINKKQLDKGIITIDYNTKEDIKTKVRIIKDEINYDYDLSIGSSYSLQLGNGSYTIFILENVKGNIYQVVDKEEVVLDLSNEYDVFLQSIQNIYWNVDMDIIKTAEELTKNAKNNLEKANIIYSYVVENIKYDLKKAYSVKPGYIPSIEATAKNGKGICYDYASLYAAMMRSIDVPTRLVMGNNVNIDLYHAWNEVYIEEIDQWIIVDTTFDASFNNNNSSDNIAKDASDYIMEVYY